MINGLKVSLAEWETESILIKFNIVIVINKIAKRNLPRLIKLFLPIIFTSPVI